jgi:hypothetical protein
MAVRLSALHAGRPLTPGRYLVLISVRGLVDPRAIVRLEVLGELKKSNTVGFALILFKMRYTITVQYKTNMRVHEST